MVRISNVTIKEYPEHYTVAYRKTIDFMKEYATFTEIVFNRIQEIIESKEIIMMDGPTVCFHNMDLNHLDIEVGFPILHEIESNDSLFCKKIHSTKVVTAIDLGDYEKQDATLEDLFQFIQEHHLESKGEIIYQYLNETEQSSNHYLTKMMIPIKNKGTKA